MKTPLWARWASSFYRSISILIKLGLLMGDIRRWPSRSTRPISEMHFHHHKGAIP